MPSSDFLSARDIAAIFAAEIERAGGRVTEQHLDDKLIIARSVLPEPREVKPGDRVQGGVALMGTDQEIRVHPYLFRQVCTNGAIRAEAVQTCRIAIPAGIADTTDLETTLREAVRACCSEEAFAAGLGEMRSAMERDADVVLTLLPLFSHLSSSVVPSIVRMIISRYFGGQDRSGFGLMNAVTSVARDTHSPQTRWNLEELGGAIPAALSSAPQRPAGAARRRLAETSV